MISRDVLGLQEAMVNDLLRSSPTVTQGAIAAAAGVSDSEVSKWKPSAKRDQGREIGASELVLLINRFGPKAVLRVFAALGGCDVVPRDAEPAADIRAAVFELCELAGGAGRKIHAALQDGRVDRSEAPEILEFLDGVDALSRSIRAALPRGA